MPRFALALLILVAVGCSSTPGSVDDPAAAEPEAPAAPTVEPAPTATTAPLPSAVPTATPGPTATAQPSPTATPLPTPTPTPAPTSTPDPTPVVLEGSDWRITEADLARLVAFVEEVHELEFTGPVGVLSDDDIGASDGSRYEAFPEEDWRLLDALGLFEDHLTRETVNQARRDRIRGLCCVDGPDGLAVVVEPRVTKLETEIIVVHELTHALHRQHRDLIAGPGRSGGFELPSPYSATFEAIAQFVAFAYLETQPEELQEAIADELPINTPEVRSVVGRVAGEMLDFAYFTAPDLADAVYARDGAPGLSELLGNPPTTTEQVVYPDRWLAGEDRVSQDRPELPAGATLIDEGRLGVAVLGWMLDEVTDRSEIDEILVGWTGDRWALYGSDGRECVAATIELDTESAADRLAALLETRSPGTIDAESESPRHLGFDTCSVASAVN